MTDQDDRPVADAVVVAVPPQGPPPAPTQPRRDVIDQIGHEFVPRVKVVVVGTAVSFPNKDNVRHHVYSFSPAKRFELPLYSGTPATPVVFDKPGVVVLGCNIHDWMIGYVYVSESPWFAKTGADGTARLSGLPAQGYAVRVWHPLMDGAEEETRQTTGPGAGPHALKWQIRLKPEFRARRITPGHGPGRY